MSHQLLLTIQTILILLEKFTPGLHNGLLSQGRKKHGTVVPMVLRKVSKLYEDTSFKIKKHDAKST